MSGSVQLPMLEDIVRSYEGHDLQRVARDLLLQPDDEKRASGILMRAADLYRQNQREVALMQLTDARRLLGFIPLSLMANIVWLAQRIGQEQLAAHECLKFAQDAIQMNYPELGLEAATAAYILDGVSTFGIIRDPELLAATGTLYSQALEQINIDHWEGNGAEHGERPCRIAIVVPNLVDHIVAYTKRVLQFARYLSSERYQLRVYVSENLSRRDLPLFPYGCVEGIAEQTGKETLKVLDAIHVPVYLVNRNQSFPAAASQLVRKLEEDQTDIAIFQSGMACPVDWMAMKTAKIPVKTGIHIGTSYYGAGLDIVFVDNPQNIERESNWDDANDGQRIILRKGTDLDVLAAQKALPRERLRIPEDAVIVGTLSNHLEQRLSAEYLELIAQVMKRHVNVWFVPIGSGTLQDKMQAFFKQGVAGRVRFAGRQLHSGSALKLLDVYASEFPVGGSQSVIEAMACGIPVVAMKWSEAHAESVAAAVVGPPYGIMQRDAGTYEKLLSHLIESPRARHHAGQSLLLRAQQQFSASNYINSLVDQCAACYRQKQSRL